jgi:DNA-binding NarL/FixJ family response regulator
MSSGGDGKEQSRAGRPALAGCAQVYPAQSRVGDRRPLRIVVADERRLMRVAVTKALKAAAGFDVVGVAAPGTDVLSITRAAAPDVVLLATRSLGSESLGCLARLCECHPDVKVIVCSATTDLEHIEKAFRRGACGYVLTPVEPAELVAAIQRVVEGAGYRPRIVPALDQDALRA